MISSLSMTAPGPTIVSATSANVVRDERHISMTSFARTSTCPESSLVLIRNALGHVTPLGNLQLLGIGPPIPPPELRSKADDERKSSC